MSRIWVPTAEARQAELNRQQRYLEFRGSWMAAYDRNVYDGAMARELAQPLVPKELQMNALTDLKELLRQLTAEHEAMAQELRRWTPERRPGGLFDPSKPHTVALDGTDLGAFPPEHVTDRRKGLRTRMNNAEGAAAMKIAELAAEAAKGPAARFEVGTKLAPAMLPEVQLLVEQFRDKPRQQQADLFAQGMKALERDDLQTALAVRRAAEVLGLTGGDFGDAVVNADPVRQAARAELATIQKLRDSWDADVVRRHVKAGMASSLEQVAAVDAPYALGTSRSEDAPPFVTQVADQ